MTTPDTQLLQVLAGVAAFLLLASIVGYAMHRLVRSRPARRTVANCNARIRAWWMMALVVGGAMATGPIGTAILFGLLSFLALREFVTLTPTRQGDHRTLAWAFFVITPFQYWLVVTQWYGLFAIFIPVYAFLFVPFRSALAGDTVDFLSRTARIQWGLMVCVFSVSHGPALLMLQIPGYEGQGVKLLLFLVLVSQFSDVFQYIWGKLLGRHRISEVSPNKTWEGLVGGGATATALGAGLWWITPFAPWQAALVALMVVATGFAGGLCMSAIKRDFGKKDFGTMLEGHGGVLDRIDSLTFSAPVFFHAIRYFFG